MKLRLKRLTLKNFKGIKDLNIDFNGDITTIRGDNAAGKTTIFDSFCWLLFNKDSQGRSDFDVQTLDKNNNVIHGLEHSVTAVLEIDGYEKTFNKILTEKWVKQRGASEKELKGTSTSYEVDAIPLKLKDYQQCVSGIINEEIFKLVTNPLYFPGLPWKDQRKILMDIIGDIDDNSVLYYNPSLNPLQDQLKDGIENLNKRTKNSINKLKEKVKSLPYRIDECNNSIVAVDIESLESQKKIIQEKINEVDEELQNNSKGHEEKLKLQDELYTLKSKKKQLEFDAKEKAKKPYEEIDKKIKETKDNMHSIKYELDLEEKNKNLSLKLIDKYTKDIMNKSKELVRLRECWAKENATEFVFDENESKCPCCGREYEEDKITEIKNNAYNNFISRKNSKLEKIGSEGKELISEIENIKENISYEEEKIKPIDEFLSSESIILDIHLSKLKELEDERSIIEIGNIDTTEIDKIDKEIITIQEKINNFKHENNIELKARKNNLLKEADEIVKKLSAVENNEKLKMRIEELKEEEQDLNIQIAQLEGTLGLCEEFTRTKVELLEESINKKFKGAVTFKLFKNLKNGGLEDCCEALVNGVPFSSANTAGRINAGLSIINTLNEHYNVSAVIFIDNSESVNKLVDVNSQIINLEVSQDKELKIVEGI